MYREFRIDLQLHANGFLLERNNAEVESNSQRLARSGHGQRKNDHMGNIWWREGANAISIAQASREKAPLRPDDPASILDDAPEVTDPIPN